MKYFFFFLAIIGFCFACNSKDNPEPALPEDFWGEASAERNGQLWTAHPACWIDIVNKTNINIELDSFYRDYYLVEGLNIISIPPITGTYRVFKLEPSTIKLHSSLNFWSGDQYLGLYEILESDSSTNRVTLESYDTLSKEIRGTFDLSYVVKKRPYPNTPDTIWFKNGQFHGKIIEK